MGQLLSRWRNSSERTECTDNNESLDSINIKHYHTFHEVASTEQKPGTTKPDNRVLVAALCFSDIGTGLAWASREDYHHTPPRVNCVNFTTQDHVAEVVPTSILLDCHGDFKSFGYTAEQVYHDIHRREKNKCFLFHDFHRKICEMNVVSEASKLNDVNGKPFNVVRIERIAISHLIGMLKDEMKKRDVEIRNMHWMITVPHTWNRGAEQIIQKAAKKAGLKAPIDAVKNHGEQLEDHTFQLVKEVEASLLYCRLLLPERMEARVAKEGLKCILLNLGGSKTVISAHRMTKDGSILEHYPIRLDDLGGNRAVEEFKVYLKNKAGKYAVSYWKKQQKDDFRALIRVFKKKAREKYSPLRGDDDEPLKLQLGALLEHPGNLPEVSTQSVRVTVDKLKLSSDRFNSFFEATGEAIAQRVRDFQKNIQNLSDISTLIIVGEYKESSPMISSLRKYAGEFDVFIPDQPHLAALKGAVLYGFKYDYIEVWELSPQYSHLIFLSDTCKIRKYNLINNMSESKISITEIVILKSLVAAFER